MMTFILSASASTAAPKVQVITHLVCRTLRPGYTDRSGAAVFSASDDEETKLCNADPVVQAASAQFLTLMTTTAGILSCLTTGYWGSRSDRKGRINTLRICIFGNLITDFMYLFVYSFLREHKGAYWFLMIAPFFEGSLGGLGAAQANLHAYIADCTNPSDRSRIFSVFTGLVYTGMAIGPAMGGFLVRQSGSLITVFIYAFASHLIFASMVWFVIPESLTPTQLSRAKIAYKESKARVRRGMGGTFVRLASVVAPLKVFTPVTVTTGDNPLKRRKDWNLTLVAAAYGFSTILFGETAFKFQYASLIFSWGAEMLGYWISITSIARVATLVMILPAVISLIKMRSCVPSTGRTPLPAIVEDPEVLPNPAVQQAGPTPSAGTTGRTTELAAEKKDVASPRLDLNTARASFVVELIAYSLMGTAKTGAVFTVYTILASLGTGYSPTLQSLALALYVRNGGEETGKLFGALSVVYALSGSILSPMLFGFTFSRTAATFPQAMFIIDASAIALALLSTLLVRLPKEGADEPVVVMTEGELINEEERQRLVAPGDEE